MSELVRIQFDIPEEMATELEILIRDAGVNSRRELFNSALTLFQWAIQERKNGNVIASVNEENKTYKTVNLPI